MTHAAALIPSLIAALFGLAVGSFLNVLIYRLPIRQSIVFPASHCTSCGTPILYRDNIPILGFLFLRGKCRACGVSISPVYPLIELITGCIFFYEFFLWGASLIFFRDVVFASILLVVFVIDLRHMIIPDPLTIAGGTLALVFALFRGFEGIAGAFGGAIVGLFVILIMALLGRAMFKRESMGLGDFKLTAMTGAFLGPEWNLIALAAAIFIGGIFGMVGLATGKTKRGEEIPFGPFIVAGCFMALFLRKPILFLINTYLSFF
jgi:leader peptidase (prepilin peptidase) / N-methyltransferase